jgi:GNAT superfamily N-acetyltransferase
MTDAELYARGAATLVASWEEYARGSAGAAVLRLDGVASAVFPTDPERGVYNNALLDCGHGDRVRAVEAMEAAYAEAGIERFAAWVHESDAGMRAELSGRGYTVTESTRAMGLGLEAAPTPDPDVDLDPLDWPGYLRYLRAFGLPKGLLQGADPSAFRVLAARLDGEPVATAVAFDHGGDCGVVSVSTLESGRRRGLATALTARQLHDALARGCTTASVQSTEMAERVYASVGFRDLGRFIEYSPQSSGSSSATRSSRPR